MASRIAPQAVPGASFIDPKTLARIGNLELLARTVVEGFLNGLHRSPHLGASMDFAEHRAYMPGDDIRRIDWKLFARSDRYFIKEFEADTNTNFLVLLDVSASMGFAGPGSISKLDYAKYLAACLSYFSSHQRDRVGMVTFDNDVVDYVPPSAKHLNIVLHTLDRLKAGGKGELERPLRKISESVRRRSMLVLISDLYHEPEDVLRAIAHLRGKGNDLIVFHVLDRAELEFPFDTASQFEDVESGEKLPVIPDKLRSRYREMIAGHIDTLGRLLGQNRIDYTLFDTSKPLDHALFTYLSNRQRLMRVR
ncbi:MAG TPA: DUF58 domain-containing protein [Gemmatimonadaceae bacterium]|nr:DUF58 domain-containing protein [Gemmatimonadaceae bacterium]